MSYDPYEPSEAMRKELWGLICGDELGRGAARVVLEHCLDPHVVVKVEPNACSFQNVMEWQAWEAVRNTDLAKWFAPCVAISPNGSILVQRRTTRAAVHPEKVPAFFTDLKLDNFGVLTPKPGEPASQFVCHDYGLNMLLERGMTRRMVKAMWWNL